MLQQVQSSWRSWGGVDLTGMVTADYADYVKFAIMWSSSAGPLMVLGRDGFELHIISESL